MSMNRNNPIRQEKLRKRDLLLKQGVNPYPHTWYKTSWNQPELSQSETLTQKDISTESSEETFYLAGRLMRKRNMGKASFFNLQDQWGEFQCYIRKDSFADQKGEEKDRPEDSFEQSQTNKKKVSENTENLNPWDLWKLCDIGDIIAVKGSLFKTKTGQLSLKIQDLNILCKSVEPLPEKYHGLEDIELKYRFRHLDLIMDKKSRKIFETRSEIIHEIRAFMRQKNFIEMETPVLQPVYGGAMAEPFETHFKRLDYQKMYLKVSPEIYLKKLIVGGFEKVFEIGKNFRNEGIDRTHNPEFTMMEYYQAYTDYQDQMKLFEEMINHVVKCIKGSLSFEYQGKELVFQKEWERLTLKKALQKYSDLKINKDNELLKKALPEGHSCLDPDKLSHFELFGCIQKTEPSGDYKKFEQSLNSKSLSKEQEEDLKGELVVLAFELLVEKHLWNPVFITDFPLSVSPLTKKHREKEQTRLVERFEPYIAGMELGNAYTELNDPLDQKERLLNQNRWLDMADKKESEKSENPPVDENFLHALEVGMPPTGGVGLGIERLVMILSDQKSIRDCILFPALKKL